MQSPFGGSLEAGVLCKLSSEAPAANKDHAHFWTELLRKFSVPTNFSGVCHAHFSSDLGAFDGPNRGLTAMATSGDRISDTMRPI